MHSSEIDARNITKHCCTCAPIFALLPLLPLLPEHAIDATTDQMRLLSVILPLAYNNGLPYVREQGLDVLIDSGAGRSYLAQAVLDEDGPLAAWARSVGAEHSCEAAGLQFPGASGGILGFDALGAGSSFELTLNELRLDETASPASSVVLTAKALGTATAPYPVTTRAEISVDIISMA